jgi:hypothetical protein
MKRNWTQTHTSGLFQSSSLSEGGHGHTTPGEHSKTVHQPPSPVLDRLSNVHPTDSSQDEGDPKNSKIRVGVSSKVNFTKLSRREKYMRYHNQAHEIKKLRKKFAQYSHCDTRKPRADVLRAADKAKTYKPDMEDQAEIVENLVHAVKTRVLLPGTLGYNQICTILRDVLHLSYPDWKYQLKLPETTVALSSYECMEYGKLSCTPQIYRLLLGRKHDAQDDPEHMLLYLHRQRACSHSSDGQATPTQFC